MGDQILKYKEQEIFKGDTAKVTIGTSDQSPPLSLPDGKAVKPESFKEPRPQTFNVELGALIFTIALIICVITLAKRSRLKQKSNSMITEAQQAKDKSPKEETSEGVAFCEECGRRIPPGSTFCPHCGDKQGVA